MLVKIFTDGAARGNPDGPGGYGTVLEYVDGKGQLHTREYSCGYKKTTNNRMELMAAIVGLEALNRPCNVELYSDSKYLVDAFNQKWIDSWLVKGWKNSDKSCSFRLSVPISITVGSSRKIPIRLFENSKPTTTNKLSKISPAPKVK